MRPQDRARQLRPYIEKAAKSLSDAEAVEAPELSEAWDGNGHDYIVGDRFKYEVSADDVRLYKVINPHTSQPHYPPTITSSLCEEIPKPGQGDSPENPIRFHEGLALENGKYYEELDVIYICFRDSGQAIHNPLASLIDIYVRVYNT